MSELLVQHTELSSDPCAKLTARVLELVGAEGPIQWDVVVRDISGEHAEEHTRYLVNSALGHAVRNGLVVADINNFLQLPVKSSETIETAPNY